MNWASVCGGNVGGVLMYMQPEIFRLYIPRFINIMNSLIEGFADDGTCLEFLSSAVDGTARRPFPTGCESNRRGCLT